MTKNVNATMKYVEKCIDHWKASEKLKAAIYATQDALEAHDWNAVKKTLHKITGSETLPDGKNATEGLKRWLHAMLFELDRQILP